MPTKAKTLGRSNEETFQTDKFLGKKTVVCNIAFLFAAKFNCAMVLVVLTSMRSMANNHIKEPGVDWFAEVFVFILFFVGFHFVIPGFLNHP